MAYASWLSPSTLSGSNSGTVTVSATSNNTGRNSRSTTVTFTGAGTSLTRTITQGGQNEFTTIPASDGKTKDGGVLTITGTSNSSQLTFSLSNDNIGLSQITEYKVKGQTVANGQDLADETTGIGDPGATEEFNFQVQLTLPANQDTSSKTCSLNVLDHTGTTHSCIITLDAGDAYLSVGNPSGDLPWNAYSGGNTISIQVNSNTSWTIS